MGVAWPEHPMVEECVEGGGFASQHIQLQCVYALIDVYGPNPFVDGINLSFFYSIEFLD